jgi:hypothetical protein
MNTRRIAAASALFALASTSAVAQQRQAPNFSIEGAGAYQALNGNFWNDLNDGRGAEASFTAGISNFSITGGYQRTWHDVSAASASGRQAVISGYFVEPRLALPFAASNFTPYIYGRAGTLERVETISSTERRERATQLGGGVGTLIYLARGVQLNVGGGYQWLRAGQRLDPSTRPNGGAYVVRAGLTLGSSGWARDPGY